MKTLYKFICMGVAFLSTSCIYDSSLETPDSNQNDFDEITLHLNITAGKTLSRASEHELHPSEEAESFINIRDNDYKIYILNGNDNKIVKEFEPTSIEESSKDSYKLSGSFPYDENLKSIKILVLANWTTEFTTKYPDIPVDGTIDLDNLYKNNSEYNFNYPTGTGSTSWYPNNSDDKKTGIPMFGLSEKVDIPEKIKNIPGLNPELEIPSIPMLRTLGKIIVENAIKDEEEIEEINCKLTKYNSNGRFIPDGSQDKNPDWYIVGTQVVKPSFPNQTEQKLNLQFIPSQDGKTFTVYIPEMDVKSLDEKPYIEVNVKFNKGLENSYEIQLGEYDEDTHTFIEDSYFDSILRNHRYKYNILSITNGFKVSFGPDNNIHLDDPDDWDGWYEWSNNTNNEKS